MSRLPTTCGLCGCGCGLYVEPGEGGVECVYPSANHPVSRGSLCLKGWQGAHALTGPARLKVPLVRQAGELRPTSWGDAIARTVEGLQKVRSERGAGALGVIGSPNLTNEECYALGWFARAVLGTPHVDNSCRFYDAGLIPGLLETLGMAAGELSLPELSHAGSILLVGSNVTEQLAQVGSRLLEALRGGAKLVLADPRPTRLAPLADVVLAPLPGTDVRWLRGLLKVLLEHHPHRLDPTDADGVAPLRTSVFGADLGRLNLTCHVPGRLVEDAARVLAEHPPTAVLFGLGALQQQHGVEVVRALSDVAHVLGGKVMALRGHSNAQGACDMGLLPDHLPGYQPVRQAGARARWEEAWHCQLPDGPGRTAVEMLDGAAAGEIHGLFVLGENLMRSAPGALRAEEALSRLEFLAVSELYLTETAALADVVFPAASFLEKDGTFTNLERRVQAVRQALKPPGEARTDLDLVCDLAGALGHLPARDPGWILEEIAARVPQYLSVSKEGLARGFGTPWSAPLRVPRLVPIRPLPARDGENGELRLIASRRDFHHMTGTLSAHCPALMREAAEPVAVLNTLDAARLGYRPGRLARVRVSTPWASVVRRLEVSGRIPSGCVSVPAGFEADGPNRLASAERDPESGVPAFKEGRVQVEVLP